MATEICLYYKFGYCKRENTCRKVHLKETCQNETCVKIFCNKRHPRECLFYKNYQRCKFSNCAYKHTKIYSQNDFQEIKERVQMLEEILEIRNNEKCFSCQKCDQIVKFENDLQNHMRNHHLEDELKNLQLEVFYLKDRLTEITHKLGEMEPSTDAKKRSENTQYNTKSHSQYEYTCAQCEYSTYKWGDIQKHREILHELSYSQTFWIFCKYCGTNYKHVREN